MFFKFKKFFRHSSKNSDEVKEMIKELSESPTIVGGEILKKLKVVAENRAAALTH